MTPNKKRIGLFGLGCVGQGLYDLINGTGYSDAFISKIVVKNRDKARSVHPDLLHFHKDEILNDHSVDLIIEAIDDSEEAFRIVHAALSKGIPVVTANKKMVAEHLSELIELQELHKTPLLYEAAVCGAIPIVRNVENYFEWEPILSLKGIFNGTSNYILSKIFHERMDYRLALRKAQELGFAETDPTSDVGGFDARFKLVILAKHAFGANLKPKDVLTIGIDTLKNEDIAFARSKGWKIKLVPSLFVYEEKLVAFVLPKFISDSDQLFDVEQEFNAVNLEGAFSGPHFYFGRGAGAFPTATAVLNDIKTILNNEKYSYRKSKNPMEAIDERNVFLEVYVRYNSPELLEKLKPSPIREGYIDGDNKYFIGDLSLSQLHLLSHLIHKDKASIIFTGNTRFESASKIKTVQSPIALAN